MKDQTAFSTRFAHHKDELEWLFMELYHNREGLEVLEREMADAYNARSAELKALDKMFYKLPEDAKVTIGNGVVIVPVEKIMGQVKVDYYYKITETVERCLGYPEVVDVWKGTNIIKKSQLTRLEKACADMSYDASSVAQEILFDWADNVVKIYVKSY